MTMYTVASTIASRLSEKDTESPVGLIAAPAPYQSMPTSSDTSGSRISAPTDSSQEATAFLRSSRCRGTGIASRYFRLDHEDSLAIVPPKNNATIIGRRRVPETNNASPTKFGALAGARSTNPPLRRFG